MHQVVFLSVLFLACLRLTWTAPVESSGDATTTADAAPVTNDTKALADPEYDGEMFEGDIMGVETSSDPKQLGASHNGVIEEGKRWSGGIIPFDIDVQFTADEVVQILNAMDWISDKTCVKFVPRTTEKDYVSITAGTGCSSYVGKIGGKQEIIYSQRGCFKLGRLQHEMMHAIGFYHEQSRMDRDQYVTINWDNIDPTYKNNFVNWMKSTAFGYPYDYDSAMHYPSKVGGFAIRPEIPIITVKNPNESLNNRLGQRDHLSDIDVKKINAMYCAKKAVPV